MADRRNAGFTLLELLVAMGILSVLVAISTHLFHVYKANAFDARAVADLKSAIQAEESIFLDSEAYVACNDASCETDLPGFLLSSGIQITITLRDAGQTFDVQASHASGSNSYEYHSDVGSIVGS